MYFTAREIGAATQPEWLGQPLSQSGWGSHSATVAGAATQPLSQSGWGQPLSHSARVAGATTQPL